MLDIKELIQHPEQMDRDTLYELRSLIALYPYFQTARLLMLQNLYLLHDPTFDEELRRSAIYITDRRVLFQMIEGAHYQLNPSAGNTSKESEKPEETAKAIIDAVRRQGSPDFRLHAVTGSKDIAYPNLDPQMQALKQYPGVFDGKLRYDVLENGVHDYETIFRYLYNVLPGVFH